MKIFAIGMNYSVHNKSLHGPLFKPENPVVFTKAETALLKNHKPFFIPDDMGPIEYESELVVRINRLGKCIDKKFAHRYYDAVTVGIDFTARQLQGRLRKAGEPWELAKAFDNSAPIGEWIPMEEAGDIGRISFHMDLNGQTVQEGFSGDMLFGVDEIIAYISRFFTLKTGDIIFTGCPSPCAPVHEGDHIEGWIGPKRVLDFMCK